MNMYQQHDEYFINSKGREVACGVIVTDGKRLVAIKPWGKALALDIPKGHLEKGEEEIDAAIRELQEETSITVDKRRLKRIGEFPYTSYKDLILFLYKVPSLPSVESLKCNSTFTNLFGRVVNEAVGFELAQFHDIRFYTPLQPILRKLQKRLHVS